MIIDDFDIPRVSIFKPEAQPPLVVDPDGPLTLTVSLQFLQPITRRCPHIVQKNALIELVELTQSHFSNRRKPPVYACLPKFMSILIANTTYHVIRIASRNLTTTSPDGR